MTARAFARRRVPGSSSLIGSMSLLIALASAIAVLVLYIATDLTVRTETQRTMARTIDTDIAGLADIYASGGRKELLDRIRDRLAFQSDSGGAAYYLAADAAGRHLAGNISDWPQLSAESSQADMIEEEKSTILARATRLGPDLKLVVGRGMGERDELLNRIAVAFLVAGLAIVLLAIGMGQFFSRGLRRRLDAINVVLSRVADGDFSARSADDNRRDELGDLIRHTNGMLDRLTALIDSYRQISDHMAHEMRTPLLHLDGRLLSALGSTRDEQLIAQIGGARRDIRSIVDLLESLLDIAASESEVGDRSGFVTLDLSELAEEIAELFQDSADELGITFVTHIGPGITVLGNRMQMFRLISNLLDNAFKFTPRGGQVKLEVSLGPRIAVTDTGPGVPKDMRKRVFERFTRAPGAPSHGHGLGLALAKAIAARHDFDILCADTRIGAKFVVRKYARETEP